MNLFELIFFASIIAGSIIAGIFGSHHFGWLGGLVGAIVGAGGGGIGGRLIISAIAGILELFMRVPPK